MMEKINRDDSYNVVSYCDNRDIVCYNCKKHGHYAWACPKKIVRRIRVALQIETRDEKLLEELEDCLRRRRVTRHFVEVVPPSEYIYLLLLKLNRSKYFIKNLSLDKIIDQKMNELDDKNAEKYSKGLWKKEEIQKQAKIEVIEEEIAMADSGLAAVNDPPKTYVKRAIEMTSKPVAKPLTFKIQTKQEKDTKSKSAVKKEEYLKKIKELENKERTLEKEIENEKNSWFYVNESKVRGLEDKLMDVRMDKAAIEGDMNFECQEKSSYYVSEIKPCSLPVEKEKTKPAKKELKDQIKKEMKKTRENKIKKGKYNSIVRRQLNEEENKKKKIEEMKRKLAEMEPEERKQFIEEKLEEKRERDLQNNQTDEKDCDYDLQL